MPLVSLDGAWNSGYDESPADHLLASEAREHEEAEALVKSRGSTAEDRGVTLRGV